jgi:hypothetical protein
MSSLEERVASIAGSAPVSWERRSGGYASNERWTVALEDGRRVFVKYGSADLLAKFLRDEHRVYAALTAPFMPALVGLDEDGDWPVLVLEDFSYADWPPPWTAERIDAVRATLDELHAIEPPSFLSGVNPVIAAGWDEVAEDPGPFLSLGLVDADWLERALPALADASHAAELDGDELLHVDVRSDNICFAEGRAILVDWNWACRGCGLLDLAAWLPSLADEGGPQPYELLPGQPEYAALLAGFFASKAGLPPPETAPEVREVQRSQLVVALDWVRRELDL